MDRVKSRPEVRSGVTLVELLVVVSIIGMLMAMLLPAVNRARESGRQAACQSNLRQFGVAMTSRAARQRTLCSGAFDWQRDGCVTEIGWVADLVNDGVPVGKMLCPSNPAVIGETYNDLLGMPTSSDPCLVDWLGSAPKPQPDGSLLVNACRQIAALTPGSDERRAAVEVGVYKKHFNTNYTASWYLVRSGVVVDASGDLATKMSGCSPSVLGRNSTLGPLTASAVDGSPISASFIPLLGCGASTDAPLAQAVGTVAAGEPTAQSFTHGPVRADTNTTMTIPTFAAGTTYAGPAGWWAGWNATLQDYRGFAPVHRLTCNILFADGSVRVVADVNKDGLLNNGFPGAAQGNTATGFSDNTVELDPDEFCSRWTLKAK